MQRNDEAAVARWHMRWRAAINKARRIARSNLALRADMPVQQINTMKTLFANVHGRDEPRCDVETFIVHLSSRCDNRYTKHQLRTWFDDIDVWHRGWISWETFTNAVLHEASGTLLTDYRAIEFTENSCAPDRKTFEHKGEITSALVVQSDSALITGGTDGFLCRWIGDTCQSAVSNQKTDDAEQAVLASHSACPIIAMALGYRNFVYVCAANKTINVYAVDNLDLRCRYVCRETFNELAMEPSERSFSKANTLVNTVVLMNVDDSIEAIEVVTVQRVEFLYLGLRNGKLLIYSLRNPNALELRPQENVSLHAAGIRHLSFVPELNLVVSCGWEGGIRLSDPRTARLVHRLSAAVDASGNVLGHRRAVTGLAYLTQQRMLASIARERDALVWNPAVDNPQARLQHPNLLVAIAANNDDAQLITLADDRTVRVWEGRSFSLIQQMAVEGGITARRLTCIAYLPLHSTITAFTVRPHSWSMRRRDVSIKKNGGHVEPALHCVASSRWIVTADAHTVITWEPRSGERRAVWVPFDAPQAITGLGCVHGGQAAFVLGTLGVLKIYCIANGLELRNFTTNRISSQQCRLVETAWMDILRQTLRFLIVLSPSSLTCIRLDGDDVALVSARSFSTVGRVTAFCIVPPVKAITASGAAVAFTTEDGLLHVFGVVSLECIFTAKVSSSSLVWLPSRERVLSLNSTGFQILDLATPHAIVEHSADFCDGVVPYCCAAVSDCCVAVGDAWGYLWFISLVSRNVVTTLRGPRIAESPISALEVCLDRRLVAASTLAGPVVIFDLTSRCVLGTLGQLEPWRTHVAVQPADALALSQSVQDLRSLTRPTREDLGQRRNEEPGKCKEAPRALSNSTLVPSAGSVALPTLSPNADWHGRRVTPALGVRRLVSRQGIVRPSHRTGVALPPVALTPEPRLSQPPRQLRSRARRGSPDRRTVEWPELRAAVPSVGDRLRGLFEGAQSPAVNVRPHSPENQRHSAGWVARVSSLIPLENMSTM
jgi:WD40 repeat protein